MKILQSILTLSFAILSSIQAEVLTLEDFRAHTDFSGWDSVDHGTGFRAPWSASNLTVEGMIGGYYGQHGKEGNTQSERKLARPIQTNVDGTLWGTLDFEVKTNGNNVSSTGQFLIGQGGLNKSVGIAGIASGKTSIAAPVSGTLWALRNSEKPNQMVVSNVDSRKMTRILWKLEIHANGQESFQVWFAPNDMSSEAALGSPDLKREDFDWTQPIYSVRFQNNGQSRFRTDNLFIATSLQEVADVLAQL